MPACLIIVSSRPSDEEMILNLRSGANSEHPAFGRIVRFETVHQLLAHPEIGEFRRSLVFVFETPNLASEIASYRRCAALISSFLVIVLEDGSLLSSLTVSGMAGRAVVKRNELTAPIFNSLQRRFFSHLQIFDNLRRREHDQQDVVSLVAHDLKSPLAVISSYVDMILADSKNRLSKKSLEYIKRIKVNAVESSHLVHSILGEYQIGRGLPLKKQTLSVVRILRLAAGALRHKLVDFEVNWNVEADYEVYCNEGALMHAFVNIIENAVKFSGDRKQIDVIVRHRSFGGALATEQNHKTVIVEIRDYGIGMSDNVRAKLFSPDVHGASYLTSSPEEGHGLGLSLCRKIIALHSGLIWSKAQAPGTSMIVGLPEAASRDLALPVSAEIQNEGRRLRGKPLLRKTALVLDDNHDHRVLAEKFLAALGYEVEVCSTVASALESCEKALPSLVLLDLHLGGESGRDFLRSFCSRYPGVAAEDMILIYSELRASPGFLRCDGLVFRALRKPLEKTNFDQVLSSKPEAGALPPSRSRAPARSILVLDDSFDYFSILAFQMEGLGLSLDHAESTGACLRMLAKKTYDVVLVDLRLGEESGIDAAVKIRERLGQQLAHTSIIATSFEFPPSFEAQRELFDGVLAKPLKKGALQSLVDQVRAPH